MLAELLTLLQSPDFDEEPGFRCMSMATTDAGLALDVMIHRSDGGEGQVWRIECTGVKAYQLRDGLAPWLDLVVDHPLLLPFNDPVTQLFFRGQVADPSGVVGDLYMRHNEITGRWIPFEKFINGLVESLPKLLTNTSGMLAAGPVTLLKGYAGVLNTYGVRTSMLETRPPAIQSGKERTDAPRVGALLLETTPLESSFVVAERFEAHRLSGTNQR